MGGCLAHNQKGRVNLWQSGREAATNTHTETYRQAYIQTGIQADTQAEACTLSARLDVWLTGTKGIHADRPSYRLSNSQAGIHTGGQVKRKALAV